MRSIAAFSLITLWMFGVLSGVMAGGLVHLLALGAAVLVFTGGHRATRSYPRR